MTGIQTRPHEAATQPSDGWAGWVTFAAVILALLGTLNMIEGFIALFDEGYFVVAAGELLLVDFTAWGVIMLAWGVVLLSAGLALAAGRSWARWLALLAACVNVVAQIGFLSAYPVWSAIMILFDVLVIFALTTRWQAARAAM